jgi:uncharacterized protein YpiB (UPF0302 family)
MGSSTVKKETIDTLTSKLAELNKNPIENVAERKRVSAALDRQLRANNEKQLLLFIDQKIEKGQPLNMNSVRKKAQSLDYSGNLTDAVNLVVALRRIVRGGIDER